jgi:hypothetical protein
MVVGPLRANLRQAQTNSPIMPIVAATYPLTTISIVLCFLNISLT